MFEFILGFLCGAIVIALIMTRYVGHNKYESIGQFLLESLREEEKTETIKDYKRLLDDGVLTQEEFEVKKRMVLDS